MTIQEIIQVAHEEAGLVPGVNPAPSAIIVRQYYDAVMDEIVGVIGTLSQEWTADLTSGQASYCLPPLDRIEAAWVLDSADTRHQLVFMHSRDAALSAAYSSSPPSGIPTTLIMEGIGQATLDPKPDYTKAAGIILKGYGPYNRASYALAADNPLKVQDQQAVISGIIVRLFKFLKQYADADVREVQYRREKGRIQMNASDYTPASAMQRGSYGTPRDNSLNPMGW